MSLRERSKGNLAQILTSAYAESFPERQPALCVLYQQISALNHQVSPQLVPILMEMQNKTGPIEEHAIPTLLLVGEEAVLTPPPAMQSIKSKIPHARFVTVPHAGHSVYFEQPEDFNRIVADFLRENGVA